MTVKKRIKSVIPYYGAGTIFLIIALLAPLYAFWQLALYLGIFVAAFIGLSLIFNKTIEIEIEAAYDSGDKATNALLERGRGFVMRLSELSDAIGESEVSAQIERLQNIARQIFEKIEKEPKEARKLNTFMDYYFPTALKFLERFAEFKQKQVKPETLAASIESIRDSLSKFEAAFLRQLEALYDADALDIESDVAVLDAMMKNL